MSLRVIAGKAKGRRLQPVPGDTTRPIMDRVKEALFGIIGADIWDTIFLDLFAGTGSVGIEALSRGAAQAYFFDLERAAIDTLHANLKATGLTEQGVVRRVDAFAALAAAPPAPFDFIYIAPPQYKQIWQRSLLTLDTHPLWLASQPDIIVQIDPSEAMELPLKHLQLYDERRYGKTLLWFFATIPVAPFSPAPDHSAISPLADNDNGDTPP